jgi:hypothetical protein
LESAEIFFEVATVTLKICFSTSLTEEEPHWSQHDHQGPCQRHQEGQGLLCQVIERSKYYAPII